MTLLQDIVPSNLLKVCMCAADGLIPQSGQSLSLARSAGSPIRLCQPAHADRMRLPGNLD
jgi:hypothetical protein